MLLENGSRRTVRKVSLTKLATENNLTSNLIIFNVGYNYKKIEMKQLQIFQFACRGYCLKKNTLLLKKLNYAIKENQIRKRVVEKLPFKYFGAKFDS